MKGSFLGANYIWRFFVVVLIRSRYSWPQQKRRGVDKGEKKKREKLEAVSKACETRVRIWPGYRRETLLRPSWLQTHTEIHSRRHGQMQTLNIQLVPTATWPKEGTCSLLYELVTLGNQVMSNDSIHYRDISSELLMTFQYRNMTRLSLSSFTFSQAHNKESSDVVKFSRSLSKHIKLLFYRQTIGKLLLLNFFSHKTLTFESWLDRNLKLLFFF